MLVAMSNKSDILESIPSLFRGPGGACAVVNHKGETEIKTWGYAGQSNESMSVVKTVIDHTSEQDLYGTLPETNVDF